MGPKRYKSQDAFFAHAADLEVKLKLVILIATVAGQTPPGRNVSSSVEAIFNIALIVVSIFLNVMPVFFHDTRTSAGSP